MLILLVLVNTINFYKEKNNKNSLILEFMILMYNTKIYVNGLKGQP